MQSLTYDVFVHLVRVGKISGIDLIRFTNTCRRLRHYSCKSEIQIVNGEETIHSQAFFRSLLFDIGVDVDQHNSDRLYHTTINNHTIYDDEYSSEYSERNLKDHLRKMTPRKLYITYFIKDMKLMASLQDKIESCVQFTDVDFKYNRVNSPLNYPHDLRCLLYSTSPVQIGLFAELWLDKVSRRVIYDSQGADEEPLSSLRFAQAVSEMFVRITDSGWWPTTTNPVHIPYTIEAFEKACGISAVALFERIRTMERGGQIENRGDILGFFLGLPNVRGRKIEMSDIVDAARKYADVYRKAVTERTGHLSHLVLLKLIKDMGNSFAASLDASIDSVENVLDSARGEYYEAEYAAANTSVSKDDLIERELAKDYFEEIKNDHSRLNKKSVLEAKLTDAEIDFCVRLHKRVVNGGISVTTLFRWPHILNQK